MKTNVTIDDVAREVGVSISTVSYALSGKRTISAGTRMRVLEAAEMLGYSPRASARALAARRSDIIAVTTPLHADTDHGAHMSFAMEVTTEARHHNYDTLLLVHDDALEGMRRAAATALADGIIALDVAAHDERANLARKIDLPVVFVGVPDDTTGLTCVDLDFEMLVRIAVDKLVDAGHRSIGLISQSLRVIEKEANYPLRIEREFRRYCHEIGARMELSHIIINPYDSTAKSAVDELLLRMPDVTGIVLSSSPLVSSTLPRVLEDRHLRVPDDISVIAAGMPLDALNPSMGFDSLVLDPKMTCPRAVDLLVDLIEEKQPSGQVILVPPTYETRGSVAMPRVAHSS